MGKRGGSSPVPASAWFVAISFAASPRSFLTRIEALILSADAAKMLCTFDPPSFGLAYWLQKLLSCYLEVAQLLQYASVVSTSVSDKFVLLFLVLVLAAVL